MSLVYTHYNLSVPETLREGMLAVTLPDSVEELNAVLAILCSALSLKQCNRGDR